MREPREMRGIVGFLGPSGWDLSNDFTIIAQSWPSVTLEDTIG